MKLPHLQKKPELKSCHDVTWEDNDSWIHQKDILDVLKDKEKLNSEVKDDLEQENQYADLQLKNTKDIQKKLGMRNPDTLRTCSMIHGKLNGQQLIQRIIKFPCSMVLSRRSN